MTTEAERLAIELMNYATCTDSHCDEAAFLLRKLQAENESLKDAKEDANAFQATITEMCKAIPDYDWSGGAAGKIAAMATELEALRVSNAKLVQELDAAKRVVALALKELTTVNSVSDMAGEFDFVLQKLREAAELGDG